MSRPVFILDLDRCTGCSACAIACRNENQTAPDINWRSVTTFNSMRLPQLGVLHFALSCNHCENPSCLRGCPASAYSIDSDGVVNLDTDRCMGCRYCLWVCPYGAPQFNESPGTMEKCTLCPERREQGRDPACVTACPVGALGFEIDGEPLLAELPGFPDAGTRPGIRITRRSVTVRAPEMTIKHPHYPLPEIKTADVHEGLKAEWPLWFFTSSVTAMVVWFVMALIEGVHVLVFPFAVVGAVAMGISALHLGNVKLMYRAIFNFRTSWISREVFFFSAFFLLACLHGLAPQIMLGKTALACGFLTLLSIDMVYRVRGQDIPMFGHSAMTLFSASFLVAILTRAALPLLVIGVFRAVIYSARGRRGPWAMFRITGLVILPALLWVVDSVAGQTIVITLIAIAELRDRAELYAELRFLSPQLQVENDLELANREY